MPPPRPVIAPHVAAVYPEDGDRDAIDDALTQRRTRATPSALSERVEVELVFTAPITQQQINDFLALDGVITHVFRSVSYGWIGTVPLNTVSQLKAALGDSLVLVQEARPLKMNLVKATQTGRVRPVWASSFNNGTGYDGSTNITIAFIDSGIDENHADLAGRKVSWADYSFDASISPVDHAQHGTHVAGIALGSGLSGGSATGNLYYSHIGDISAASSGSFLGGTIAMPLSNITWTSGAKWTGGGSTSLRHYYSALGTLSYTAFGTNSGTSPLSRVSTYVPVSTRKYTSALLSVGNGTVDKYVITNIVQAHPGVGDGFNKFRGVAPGCRWAMAKAATSNSTTLSSWYSSALDDLVTDRVSNKIKIVNVSFSDSATNTTLRQKVNTAADNGIVVVISAGNDGASGGQIYDPGLAAKGITVAAANHANQLTEYTSLGITSGNITTSGQETDYKPDLMAPGGSDYYYHILSTDSGSSDSAFPDAQTNDYTTEQGTSMSAPFISGCVALLIDAMESSGYTWNFYTNDHPMFIKMLLNATATESNTNREDNSNNPTLQRNTSGPNSYPSGKDRFEGYGMVNPDAAIEAVVKTLSLNWVTNDTLGTNAIDRRAWARKLSLTEGQPVTVSLAVPTTGDYDLYLYSYAPSNYGAPRILASSVTTGTNSDETILYTASTNETAFVVVKRISGFGTFTLATTNSNDAFTNAFTLKSTYDGTNYIFNTTASQTGNNTGYGTETGEHSQITSVGGRSAWFNWKAPYTGKTYLSCNRNVQVFTGNTVSNLSPVGSQINSTDQYFTPTAGTTYRIAVFGTAGSYTLDLETVGISALPLTNSMAIVSNSAGSGPSVPYPSSITINGVTQTIINITATLFDMTHGRCADYDIGLLDPNTNWPVYLMSDAGGNTNISNLTVTFDNNSSSNFPGDFPVTNGTYRPMDYFFWGDKPVGAPGTYTNTFSGLFYTSPNGRWSLYAYDDQNIDLVGSIAGGWALNLTFDQPPEIYLGDSSVTYFENASPSNLQSAVLLSDPDSTDFLGGRLILQYSVNGTADDRLSITNQGTGGGQIGVSGTNITYSGSAIGNFSGGSGTNPLVVNFTTASATPAAAEQLITRLIYWNVSDAPSTNARIVLAALYDGDGPDGTSTFSEIIYVLATNDVPTLTTVNTITGAVEDANFTLTYAAMTNAANEIDPDGDALSFRVEAVSSGTLRKNGTNVTPGVTLLATGETWTWTPATNVFGPAIAAFTVRAKDATTNSATAIQVNIGVTNVNDKPYVTNAITNQAGTNGTPFTFTFATNVFADADTNQTFSYSATNLPPGLVLTNATRTFSGTPTQAGSYAVALVASDNGSPVAAATNTFTITISKAPLLVTASNVSRAYGSTNPMFLPTYSGFVNGQSLPNSGVTGGPVLTTGAGTGSVAGSYVISNTIGTLASSNYFFTLSNGTLTVTKAPLIVTASNTTRVYGDVNPAFQATYSGFANGQNLANSGITGAPSLTCAASTTSVLGAYVISNTLGSLAATNYSFTLSNGTMTVTSKPMSVTAGSFSRAYGAPNPTFTGVVSGVTASDVITSGYSTVATSTNRPGDYNVVPQLVDPGGRLGNYTVTTNLGTLSITSAPLLVAASNVARVYGGTNPPLQATYAGFANGETLGTSDLTGTPLLNTLATNNSTVGAYTTTCGAGSLVSTNYFLSFGNGTLTVFKATLVCGPSEMHRAYGATNPSFLYSFYPFANDETLETSDVTGTPDITCAATVSSPTGNYAIVVSNGTLASSNYSFAMGGNWLVVEPVPLVISPNSYSRLMGETNPVLTGIVTGIVNDDVISADYSTTATTSSPAGVYPIMVSLNDPGSKLGNYSVTTNPATLTITNLNQAPSVTLTQPVASIAWQAGDTHILAADASDTDGTVVLVEFYVDGSKLGETTNEPYLLTWTNLAAGIYALDARATDNNSAMATSPIVVITSQPAYRQTLWVTGATTQFQMTFHGASGAVYLQQYSFDLQAWTNALGFTGSGVGVILTDTNLGTRRFYRVIDGPQ